MAIPESAAEAAALLGVAPGANAAAVRKRYRELAMRFHPDLNPDDPQADQRMAELNRARDLLADGVPLDVRRARGASAAAQSPPAGSQAESARRPQSPEERAETRQAFSEQMERARRVDDERRRRRQAARRRERREAEARAQRAEEEARRAGEEARQAEERDPQGGRTQQDGSRRAGRRSAHGEQAQRSGSRRAGGRSARDGAADSRWADGRSARGGRTQQGAARRGGGSERPGSGRDSAGEAGGAGQRKSGSKSGASASASSPIERVCEALSARGWGDAAEEVRARYQGEGAVAPRNVEFVLSVMRDGALYDAALVVAAPGTPLGAPLLDEAIQRASEEGAPFAFAMNERMFRRADVRRRTRTHPATMERFPSPEELLTAFEEHLADAESGGGERGRDRGPSNFGRLFRR